MGIGKCFKNFCEDCANGCAAVTEKYEVDGDVTNKKFVCTKVSQEWVDQARAEMEYKRNRRFCPHCKLELPMLPKPLYAQEHSKNLWKVEPEVAVEKVSKKTRLSVKMSKTTDTSVKMSKITDSCKNLISASKRSLPIQKEIHKKELVYLPKKPNYNRIMLNTVL